MSLINDALKRAKQTQEANPPATPALEFRPVEPAQGDGRRTSLLLVGLSLVTVALIGMGATLLWYVSQKNGHALLVEASSNYQLLLAATNTPTQPEPKPTPPVTVVDPANTTPAVAEVVETSTNNEAFITAVGAVVEALKPAPLKLQGIFFNPKNPSAVVNGKTVYLGERTGGFFVLAISPTSVTFANGTVTNVLSLSE
ncbi:MAG: hypothetical protein DVB33_10115 [Verrucomicrobia bacterium]|nr:MAG: hypothetical protein DVB33_10115 [Verrucomicrobiota bacterium]